MVGGHVSPEVSKQGRIIVAEEGSNNQALLEQALDLLFGKREKEELQIHRRLHTHYLRVITEIATSIFGR